MISYKHTQHSETHEGAKQGGHPWCAAAAAAAAAAAKSLQSCLTLCSPIDGEPGLQARTLEWVAISFSSA